ncbi:MAG: hypothetical protein ACK4V6_08865, partial [Microthrixaceae bacterium]
RSARGSGHRSPCSGCCATPHTTAGDRRRPRSTTSWGEDLAALGVTLELPAEMDPGSLVAVVAAWTQTFGLVSFEVFGQTARMVRSDALLFEAAARATAMAPGLDDVDPDPDDAPSSDP